MSEQSDQNRVEEPSPENLPPLAPTSPVDPQTELGLGEPPEDSATVKVSNTWADRPTEAQLKQWWEEFLLTQPMRISSLLKMATPKMEADEVVIVMPPSRIEPLEPVKYPFNRFIQEISGGALKRLRIDAGEVEQLERKPYTDKEKLEFLQKNNPKLAEVIDKLDLRLP